MLPTLDIWLDVGEREIHYVQHLLLTLDWNGGLLGVRLRLEPTKLEDLKSEYVVLRQQSDATIKAANKNEKDVLLWPTTIKDFLERGFGSKFRVRSYILDRDKLADPENGNAKPQLLAPNIEASEDNPFSGLIRIDEVNAQRGFSDEGHEGDSSNKRRLSDQVRSYFDNHLNPSDMPKGDDITALEAIYQAQNTFNIRLKSSLEAPLKEIEGLGYPGLSDPKVKISTQLKLTDGLNHASAFQYEVDPDAHLPEQYNGLGYQNLFSMAFRLMSFRDAWMQVGKAEKKEASKPDPKGIPPIHLVLIEEPEAHLHVQVQQVFMRKAYTILRNHDNLKENKTHTTQMVVSTHSSHIAHECEFSCLRYFRRKPVEIKGEAPASTIINLSTVFGDKNNETARFVARYLKSAHCDLFFADAAILIEGTVERMLLPHFIRKNYHNLDHRYLTILEVGGSHAHRFKPLIEHLELTTLLITDIDVGSKESTSNPTLRDWLPKQSTKDALLAATGDDKTYSNKNACFSVRVAYQLPVKIAIEQDTDTDTEAIDITPNTFEDALFYENIDIFKTLTGTGLITKFCDASNKSETSDELKKAIDEAIKNCKSGAKAEFALELLFYTDPQDFAVPKYIGEGLKWLEQQVTRCEEKLIASNSQETPQKEAS